MNFSSTAKNSTPDQFRRCTTCSAGRFFSHSPSTALPCKCGGEMCLSAVTSADVRAERERCAAALESLAVKCVAGAGPDGKVSADGAADHMRALAAWMRFGD